MSFESRRELEVTRAKLKLLEERLTAVKAEPAENRRSQEWSVRSLTQTINQLKEEIARFESRARGGCAKALNGSERKGATSRYWK
jgi:hypothetical protein